MLKVNDSYASVGRFCFLFLLVVFSSGVSAQVISASTGVGLLPAGAFAKKADEFLAALRPPTSLQKLESGNDLLLEFSPVVSAGPVRFKMVSTMPRTDGMWLLSLSPQPDSGVSLFLSISLEPSALPEATVLLSLRATEHVLFVARAGGRYYGLVREIKIGQPVGLK